MLKIIVALFALLLLNQSPNLHGVGASIQTVVLAPCTSADIFAAPDAPQAPGATVTLTSFAGGCGTPEFRFLLLAPGTSTWVFKTAYSATSTYAWNTAGAAPGVWQIGVWVRAVGSTASHQAYAIGAYAIVTLNCTAVAVTFTAIFSASIDLTITATATGCPAPFFEWRELGVGSSTWTTVQAYLNTGAGGNVFHTVFPPGQGGRQFAVLAKQTGSTHSYDTYQLLTTWF